MISVSIRGECKKYVMRRVVERQTCRHSLAGAGRPNFRAAAWPAANQRELFYFNYLRGYRSAGGLSGMRMDMTAIL